MSGHKAVWNLAHGKAPLPGFLIFRRCVTTDCVNPVHMGEAKSKADIGEHIARNGARKGTYVEQRAASAAIGRAVRGIVDTPAEIVLALRAAPASVSNLELAAQHGLSHTTVSSIRLLRSRRCVQEVAA
jgi:ethanolamine utilization microcompartment shell protein EutL